jgi:hypothetical protein
LPLLLLLLLLLRCESLRVKDYIQSAYTGHIMDVLAVHQCDRSQQKAAR